MYAKLWITRLARRSLSDEALRDRRHLTAVRSGTLLQDPEDDLAHEFGRRQRGIEVRGRAAYTANGTVTVSGLNPSWAV